MTPQLSLFNENDAQQPVPLEVAALYGFPLQHHVQADDTIVYAVQDWISGVAQAQDPQRAKNIFQMVKRRAISVTETLVKLPYRAANGKTYQMDFADETTLYQITQRMDANTGIRNDVLTYLAKSGAFVSLVRQDQEAAEIEIGTLRRAKTLKSEHRSANKKAIQQAEKDPTWQLAREMGIVTRKQFTAALVALNPHINLGRATNEVYEGTLGTNADGLRKALEIGSKQNPREHLSALALGYVMISEESCRIQLSDYADDDILPIEAIHAVIVTVSEAIGLQAEQWAKTLNVDLITGRKLLKP